MIEYEVYLFFFSSSRFLDVSDDLLSDVLRTSCVVGELHGELTTTGSHGAKVTDVAEHVAERGVCFDADTSRCALLLLDHATATVEVTDDVTNVVFWGEDVELHDGLKDLWSSFGHGCAVSCFRGDLEGNRGGVNSVLSTVNEGDFEVQAGESSEDTFILG